MDTQTVFNIAQAEVNIAKIKRTLGIENAVEGAKHIILMKEQSGNTDSEEFSKVFREACCARRRP